MPRLARLRDALLPWSLALVVVALAVDSARPVAEPREPTAPEAMHRCRPGCHYYSHSARNQALADALTRAMAVTGEMEIPDDYGLD